MVSHLRTQALSVSIIIDDNIDLVEQSWCFSEYLCFDGLA